MPNRQVKAALDSSYQLEGTSVRVIIREGATLIYPVHVGLTVTKAMEYLMW